MKVERVAAAVPPATVTSRAESWTGIAAKAVRALKGLPAPRTEPARLLQSRRRQRPSRRPPNVARQVRLAARPAMRVPVLWARRSAAPAARVLPTSTVSAVKLCRQAAVASCAAWSARTDTSKSERSRSARVRPAKRRQRIGASRTEASERRPPRDGRTTAADQSKKNGGEKCCG